MEISKSLLEECAKKNRKAQYEIYRECFPLLMGICSRYYQNDIDSRAVLNEGFLKIISNLEKYSPEVPFKFWIRKIMINTIIDQFRRARHYHDMIIHAEQTQLLVVGESTPALQEEYDAEELLAMIRQLPPVTCKVFNLFAIDGYSHHEISELLGISTGTSKWHVATARKKLGMMLNLTNRTTVKLKSQ